MKIKNEMHILTEALIDDAPQIALDVMGFAISDSARLALYS